MIDKIKGLIKYTDCSQPTNEVERTEKVYVSAYNQAITDVVELLNDSGVLLDSEKIHYDSLLDCCTKILDAVDSGKVPQRAIMGLKLLMNR